MGRTIKSRQIVKDIKLFDRAGHVAEKVKDSTLRTKEEAEKTHASDSAPARFGTDKVQSVAEHGAIKAAQVVGQFGRGILQSVQRSAGENAAGRGTGAANGLGRHDGAGLFRAPALCAGETSAKPGARSKLWSAVAGNQSRR